MEPELHKQSGGNVKNVEDKQIQLEHIANMYSRPVFGQPSIPIAHRFSISACNSAFTNYADERSPFAQLTRSNISQTGMLLLRY